MTFPPPSQLAVKAQRTSNSPAPSLPFSFTRPNWHSAVLVRFRVERELPDQICLNRSSPRSRACQAVDRLHSSCILSGETCLDVYQNTTPQATLAEAAEQAHIDPCFGGPLSFLQRSFHECHGRSASVSVVVGLSTSILLVYCMRLAERHSLCDDHHRRSFIVSRIRFRSSRQSKTTLVGWLPHIDTPTRFLACCMYPQGSGVRPGL